MNFNFNWSDLTECQCCMLICGLFKLLRNRPSSRVRRKMSYLPDVIKYYFDLCIISSKSIEDERDLFLCSYDRQDLC